MKVPTPRAPNAVVANCQKLASATGQKTATGRNVNRHLADRRWDVVEVWTLRAVVNGKAVVMGRGVSREAAESWVATES